MSYSLRLSAWTGAAVTLCTLAAPSTAAANPYDISLRGVGRPVDTQSLDAKGHYLDPAIRRYRFLANELAVAMFPRPMAPAETLGINGFEISVGSNITPISAGSGYWQGQPGNPVFEGVATGRGVPEVLWTPTAHIRKGLPLSMEVGLTGSYLAWSEMFMLGVEYKIAWHEAFWRWLPAFATRVAFSRLFGSSDLDIIAGEIDALASLPFGLGGMAQFTPYIGYGQLFAHINSQVLDSTPYDVTNPTEDQRGGPDGSLYNFPTIPWDKNSHGRLIVGGRLIFAFLELVFEFNYLFMDGPNQLTSYSVKFGFDV